MTRFAVNKSSVLDRLNLTGRALIHFKTRHATRDSAEFTYVTVFVTSSGFNLVKRLSFHILNAPPKIIVNWFCLGDPILEATVYDAYHIIPFLFSLYNLRAVRMNGSTLDFRSIRMSS